MEVRIASKFCPTCGAPNGSSTEAHSVECRTSGWSKAYDLAMFHAEKLCRAAKGPSALAEEIIELVSGNNPITDPEVVLATALGCPKELR